MNKRNPSRMNMVWLVQNENQYSFVEVTMKQFDG